MQKLPVYLCFKTNGAPLPGSVVCSYMERLYRYLKAGGTWCPDRATCTPGDSMRTRMWELASIEIWMQKKEDTHE